MMMLRSAVRHFARRSANALVSAACVAGILATSGAAYGQGLYQPPAPTLSVGTTPQGVAAGDFARSGFQSLVVTDSASHNMKVYLATGPATFGSSFTYGTCTGPTAVLAKDVNQDGYPDIVVACPSTNTVELFVNDGASAPGSFSESASFNPTDPVAMAAGDFLGTGTVDLAVASGSGGVTIYLNVGGTVVTNTAPLGGTLTGIVTGDFNHDGHLDLAVSDSANNNVHVLTGDGAGNFALAGSYSTGSGTAPNGIVAADFNNDGNLDVATINSGNNTATVLTGSASGALTLQAAQSTGTGPVAIAVTDVNSDGYPDVIAFDSFGGSSGGVAVLLGNGNGTLQAAQISVQPFTPGTLAAVADFNRDGKPDLALTRQNNNQVSVMLNNTLPTQYPDGRSYSGARALNNGHGNMADAVAVGDFNKDGLLDIAVTYLSDNEVRVLTNNGNGFNAGSVYSVGQQPYWVASADLNGDGYPDLVTANTTPNAATGTVSVLLNNGKSGNGTFGAAVSYPVGKDPYQVAIGDINNDGYPDLAVTNYASNSVTILMGSKTGTFTVSPTTLSTCVNPYGVVIGDFKHNNYPSIAVSCYGSAQMEIFPNNGNGTFGAPTILTTDKNPATLVVGDFNRDGNLDIVVGNTTANDVYFFAGNGNNGFAAGVESPSLNFPATIAAGDVNGDGILDIVGVAPNYNAVEVTLGKGDGTFGTFDQRSAGEFPAAKQPWGLALGDFNNDGQLDIVTANTYNQVNIAQPAYQQRYMTEYPAVPGGNPSIDVLTNDSAASISLTSSPASPIPDNNTDITITASVQPALNGTTPTGSIIFENSAGSAIGAGPYTLDGGGNATYDIGHLGSGSYLFTSLYSGDSNYQPTTASGVGSTVSVAGTPVSLTVTNPVEYSFTFTASAIVTGTAGLGVPTGSVTVEAAPAVYNPATGTFSSVGTFAPVGTIPLAAAGNNSSGNITIQALTPNLNAGTYAVEGVYNPTNGNYTQGTSSYQLLVVTQIPTTTAITCNIALGPTTCTATVRTSNPPAPGYAPNGDTVTFSGTGVGPTVLPIVANGKTANYTYYTFLGGFTINATFPAQGNYAASSASVNGFCFIFFCVADTRGPGPVTFNSLTGLGSENTRLPNQPAALKANKPVAFPMF
jgi:hypothetical protein